MCVTMLSHVCLQQTSHKYCSHIACIYPRVPACQQLKLIKMPPCLSQLQIKFCGLGPDSLLCVVQSYASAVAKVNVKGTGKATVDVSGTAKGIAKVGSCI